MSRLRDLFGVLDCVRYALWRLVGWRPLTVRLRTGERLILRPPPSTDLATANEVFVQNCYRSPRLGGDEVRVVADLGGNVGYSVLYWLRVFPRATVVTFEPHPAHCEQLRRHLRTNAIADRVELVEAAAGVADGRVVLSDAENCSAVVAEGPGLAVPVVDVFARLGQRSIDLMKIDIEGSEYPILADPRFATLRPRAVVLEWHARPDGPSGPAWCEQRFAELGYEVVHTQDVTSHGIVWAFRDTGLPRKELT